MDNRIKILGVVVTYYPKPKELLDNLAQYLDFIDYLIIWENTPSEDKAYKIEIPPQYWSKVSFMGIGKNMGIAYPLNRAVEWGIEYGFTHLLTMDQDSKWQDFSLYKKEIESYASNEKIALFTPKILNVNANKFIENNLGIITSGAMVSMNVFKNDKKYAEDYFIDNVDYEFYYYLLSKGYMSLQTSQGVLLHSLGYYKNNSQFLNLSFAPQNYSAFRLFYITRNGFWLWRDYHKLNVLPIGWSLYNVVLRMVKRSIKVLLAETHKKAKLKAIALGFYYGVWSRRS